MLVVVRSESYLQGIRISVKDVEKGEGVFPEFAEFGGQLGTTSLFLLVGNVSSPWIILEKSAGAPQGTAYLAPRISRCLAGEDYTLPKSA